MFSPPRSNQSKLEAVHDTMKPNTVVRLPMILLIAITIFESTDGNFGKTKIRKYVSKNPSKKAELARDHGPGIRKPNPPTLRVERKVIEKPSEKPTPDLAKDSNLITSGPSETIGKPVDHVSQSALPENTISTLQHHLGVNSAHPPGHQNDQVSLGNKRLNSQEPQKTGASHMPPKAESASLSDSEIAPMQHATSEPVLTAAALGTAFLANFSNGFLQAYTADTNIDTGMEGTKNPSEENSDVGEKNGIEDDDGVQDVSSDMLDHKDFSDEASF